MMVGHLKDADAMAATRGLSKNHGLGETYLVFGPLYPLTLMNVNSFSKLPLDEANEGSLQQTNKPNDFVAKSKSRP